MQSASKASTLTFGERLGNRFWITINQLTPRNRTGDRFISWLWFVRYQRRLPQPRRPWFNDVLYAIKSSDEISDPLRVFTTDKEFVKLYVKACVGDDHNVPTLAVLRTFEECRRYAFPHRCVIKPTHLSGTVILRRSGEPIDFERIASWFTLNIYEGTREANYRPLRPKVIIEPFVFDDDNPSDIKVFCYNGDARLVQVDRDRHALHTRDFYDVGWRRQPFVMTYPTGRGDVARPPTLDRILDLARRLSAPFGFVRVDFYSSGDEVLVGELTHCHGNAQEFFVPRESEALASAVIFGNQNADRPKITATAEAPR